MIIFVFIYSILQKRILFVNSIVSPLYFLVDCVIWSTISNGCRTRSVRVGWWAGRLAASQASNYAVVNSCSLWFGEYRQCKSGKAFCTYFQVRRLLSFLLATQTIQCTCQLSSIDLVFSGDCLKILAVLCVGPDFFFFWHYEAFFFFLNLLHS